MLFFVLELGSKLSSFFGSGKKEDGDKDAATEEKPGEDKKDEKKDEKKEDEKKEDEKKKEDKKEEKVIVILEKNMHKNRSSRLFFLTCKMCVSNQTRKKGESQYIFDVFFILRQDHIPCAKIFFLRFESSLNNDTENRWGFVLNCFSIFLRLMKRRKRLQRPRRETLPKL